VDKITYTGVLMEVTLPLPRPEHDDFLLETIGIKKVKCACCGTTTAHFVKLQDDPEDFNKMMAEKMECQGCSSSAMESNDKMVWH
jgi:hypothetical protein